jgi:adenylate cyclase
MVDFISMFTAEAAGTGKRRADGQLQLHFGRFNPQEVIEHLAEPDGRYAARMRSVTVLFADLKGFTKMCDNRDPAEVVSILNGYFRCMSEALANHHSR